MFFSISHDHITMTVTGVMHPSQFVTCVTVMSHLSPKSIIKKSKIKLSLLFTILIKRLESTDKGKSVICRLGWMWLEWNVTVI